MSENDSGWVWLQGQIYTMPNGDWQTGYNWNCEYYPDRDAALAAGWADLDHDDFNVAHIVHGVMVWFGWENEQHPVSEYAEVAAQHGWTAPVGAS